MNPFTRIWLNPRDAYRSANLDSALLRFSLIWAWGAAYAFDQSVFDGKPLGWSAVAHVVMCIGVGLIGGPFYFWSLAFAMEVTGSWFKGRASAEELRRALILGGIPKALSLALYLILAVGLGNELFESGGLSDELPFAVLFLYIVLVIGAIVLAVWSVFSTAHAVAEAQQYESAWRGFFHTTVAFLTLGVVIAIPLFLLMLVVHAF